jgi:hypothetical protein
VDLSGVDKATQDAVAPFIRTVTQSVSRDPVTVAPIISGQRYLDLTRAGSDLQKVAGGDGLPAQYAQRLITILHDGLSAGASPADQALLATSRQQYRALRALEAAAGSDGSFTPADLVSATKGQSDRYGGSRGTLDPLAEAGKTVVQGQGGGLAGTGAAAVPGAVAGGLTYGAAQLLPGLLGMGAMAVPALGAAGAAPLMAQAINRNPEIVARAIRTLQGGANFAPYVAAPAAVVPSVVASQQGPRKPTPAQRWPYASLPPNG